MKTGCYFSTFIDEETITCSRKNLFDEFGFPLVVCDKICSCNIIKVANLNFKRLIEERLKCMWCGTTKSVPTGLCPKCHRFNSYSKDMKTKIDIK